LVEAGKFAVRTVLSEAGDRGQNDTRVDLAELFVTDTEPMLYVRAIVFDHDIGPFHHPLEQS
jgi:hypothetical protein